MSEKKSRSLLSAGLSLSLLTLCSRILGLFRERTKAAFLGTSKYADAFGIAFMIPNLLRRLFAENAISVAFIPTFKGYLEDPDSSDRKKEIHDFLSATVTLITFLTTCVVLLGIFLSPLIVRIFLDKNDAPLITETALLTRIMFPYLIVISIAAFFQGILNGAKIFSPSGFTPVLFNSIVIAATYILTPVLAGPSEDSETRARMAARAMSLGVISGGLVQALFQLPFVLRTNWTFAFTTVRKAFSNPGTRKVMRLIVPTIIGMAAYQLNDVVSTALAGKAGTGIVSSLQYSLRLQELILGIFAVSIGSVILPDLSGLAKKEKWHDFNEMLAQASKIMALISIPITFLSLLCGEEIISLVYKSKEFTDESVRLTLVAFRWHIAGLFFIALNRVISPAFYAQGNTKSPTIAGIIGFSVNIGLALLAVTLRKDGTGGGIALALSVASLANTAALFCFLRKNSNLDVSAVTKGTLLYGMKLVILSALASAPSFFVRKASLSIFGDCGNFLALAAPLLATALCYGLAGIILLLITKDEIVKIIIRKIKK